MLDYDKQDSEGELLCDVARSGKERDWKGRKAKNIILGQKFEELGYSRLAEKVFQCAEVLKFQKGSDGYLKLYQTWFCKNKLCPICNWRRSLKHSYQSSRVIDRALEEYPNARFLFLTLTIENVPSEFLNDTLSDMSKAFHRLFNRKKIKRNILGFIRATEVTYNKKRDDYHPHIHVLLMVRSTYFKNKENYLTHADWTNYWEESAKINYRPVVDIRAVKSKIDDKGEDEGLHKAIKETAKYPVKPFDMDEEYQKLTRVQQLKITKSLYEGLYRKRQIAYGGLLKVIKKELELDDAENGDLVNVADDEKIDTLGDYVIAKWDWRRWGYFIKK